MCLAEMEKLIHQSCEYRNCLDGKLSQQPVTETATSVLRMQEPKTVVWSHLDLVHMLMSKPLKVHAKTTCTVGK